MQLLIGTTNPSKVAYFKRLLAGADVVFLSLGDLGVVGEAPEDGRTPLENARRKAQYYAPYADAVLCADSGLYFDALPILDARQPGLHIRTPGGGPRLDDEQMIAYYAQLVHNLGGRVRAYYMDACALCVGGAMHGFEATREEALSWAFDLVDTPCPWRKPGWPLDSLSLAQDGRYFLDPQRTADQPAQDESGYRARLRSFLLEHLMGFSDQIGP